MERNNLSKFFYTLFHLLITLLAVVFVILPIYWYCRYYKCRRNKNATVNKEFTAISRIFLHALGAPVSIDGWIPECDENFIVASNHLAWFDAFIITLLFNGRPGVALIEEKMFKYWVIRWFLKKLNSISIDGKTSESSTNAFWTAAKVLRNKINLFIFPEGHRSKNGKLAPFKDGTFTLARRTKTRILPVGIAGAYEFSHVGTFLFNPGRVVVCTGAPIEVEGRTEAELLEKAKERIDACTKNAYRIRYQLAA